MELRFISTEYTVRKLNDKDIDKVYELCKKNTIFYRYHPPFVTKESIIEDMYALPPNKSYDDKFYLGFFKNNILIALMDVIRDYPCANVIFIGLFMIDATFQGQGIGTKIIRESCSYWKNLKYRKVQLGVDKGNPHSNAFWQKNAFVIIGEKRSTDTHEYLLMERTL